MLTKYHKQGIDGQTFFLFGDIKTCFGWSPCTRFWQRKVHFCQTRYSNVVSPWRTCCFCWCANHLLCRIVQQMPVWCISWFVITGVLRIILAEKLQTFENLCLKIDMTWNSVFRLQKTFRWNWIILNQTVSNFNFILWSLWPFIHWISSKFQDEYLAPEFWCRLGETTNPAAKRQQNTMKKIHGLKLLAVHNLKGGARNTLKCARFMHIHVGVLIVYYIITCSILGAMVVCRKLHSQKNVVALIFTADDWMEIQWSFQNYKLNVVYISGTVCFCMFLWSMSALFDVCQRGCYLRARIFRLDMIHGWYVFEDLLVRQRFRSLDGDGRFYSKKNLVVEAGRDTPPIHRQNAPLH